MKLREILGPPPDDSDREAQREWITRAFGLLLKEAANDLYNALMKTTEALEDAKEKPDGR